MRILYVEDNPLDANLVRRALARDGDAHVAEVVTTLADARTHLQEAARYDLVLVDLHLPDGYGLDLLTEIRAGGLPLAVVVLTSRGDEHVAVAALKAGADDYQAKHEDFTRQLPATIDAALSRFRAEAERGAGRLRVLYAEHHNLDVDLTLRHCADRAPYIDFTVMHTGVEVLNALPVASGQDLPWDVLLLDYRLPGETALDLLKIIRSERRLDLPVVVVTGQGDEEVAAQTLRLGASHYLVKHPHYLFQLPMALESAYYRARLARESRRLTATLESITDGFFTLDHEWRFAFVNREAERLLRRSRDALHGRVLWDVFPQLRGTTIEAEYRRARDAGESVTIDYFYAPLEAWFEAHLYPWDGGLSVYFEDVSRRKQAERQLREQASLLDKARDAIVVRDLDDHITYWNESAERVYGWPAHEVMGRSMGELLHADPSVSQQALSAVLATGEWAGDVRHVTRGGDDVTVESRWTLVRDDEGEHHRVLAINTDVTERKRLESQFLRAQRLESLGTLAGGIAHDLNNVLAPILMSIDLLTEGETDQDRLAVLSTIETSARRGADMVRRVLSFARGVGGPQVEVHLADLLEGIERMARDTFPRNITVRCSAAVDLWTLAGDPTQLDQVLLNLSINARDAMPDGGLLQLSASNVVFDGATGARLGVDPGPHVLLEVADTGSGMSSAVVERIFEPFFTTKDLDKGTGLGLSTSLAIVQSHRGRVDVESEFGRGSTFRVYLPALTGNAPLDVAQAQGQAQGQDAATAE